ncbi:rasGAP-activating-like protein 1 isoform X2 [Histomonas meleagridis]|uniref:rasGAP-activating-like protein 1 isoform X2 n=1 Tax=Histomonas meleagridis TaxID=135588 RepID=UPI003559832E|nr:rasGAP-activating-like protein 1 isoform X2 [Histomonas meleagridis]KAH0797000.1 rasGAP-activating-like protein 1 isoform X2 [Histomonas meleagridis]
MSLLRFTNIYSEQTTRSLLWNKVLEYLTPEMIYNNNHIPFIAQLKKKNSTFFANSLRPSEILIYESPDSDSPEHYSFTDNCKISSKGITLESQSGEISEFATKDVKLWSSYLSNISSDIPLSPQLICYSFNSVPIEQPICEPFVESYEQMLLTHDLNFSIPLFDCILESENSKSLTDKLFKLYLRHGQRLRLFKEFAYYEIIYFASTPNEIYRQNNAFTQTIITFFKSELTEFINNAINPVKEEIVRHPLFDFDHPKEEDLPQIEELLNYFWVKTNESLQYIPLVIRRFLKYLRILCETHFGDINLNHKAVIGLFFLRFIVPSFNAPEAWIVNGQIDQTSFRKSVAFSKVILSVSTLETNYTKVGDRQILTPIIERNIPKMVHFLERITFVNDSEEMSGETENVNLPFDEVVEAIQEFRAFIKECSDKLLQKVKKNGFVAPLFVFEAVNALYQNDLYTKSRSYD